MVSTAAPLPPSLSHTPKACTKEVMELNYCVLNKLVNTWNPLQPVQHAGSTLHNRSATTFIRQLLVVLG